MAHQKLSYEVVSISPVFMWITVKTKWCHILELNYTGQGKWRRWIFSLSLIRKKVQEATDAAVLPFQTCHSSTSRSFAEFSYKEQLKR